MISKKRTNLKPTLIIGSFCLANLALGQTLKLEEAVSAAFTHRQSIQAAQLNIQSSESAAKSIGTFPATQLGIGQSSRADLGATDMDLFISQPFDIFNLRNSKKDIGLAQVQIAQAKLRNAKLEVQTDVASKYFAAASAIKLETSYRSLRQIAQSLLQATQRRFEEGKIPEVQVTRAQLELDRANQTVQLRESQTKASLTRLFGAMGQQIDQSNISLSTNDLPGFQPNLGLRPEIQILIAELNAVKAQSRFAKKSNLPELELIGLRSPWRNQSSEFGARIQLTWNFNDFGKQKNELQSLKQEIESIEKQIADSRLLAETEITSTKIEIDAAQQRVSNYQNLLETNRTLVQKTQLGFEQGVGTLIDVLEATRSLRELEQEIAEAELSLNLAQVSLYAATGTLLEETN